ncbi:ATP-binding protein [Altererythrobacter sp. H2]|uniref:two-component system sensor histidine kinase NtrB n=1 Tax=Altererythrobacter sp. H2 TaxID=3108391 RepID=UPI002B4BC668|nr:ATP-binding protein [Altererythrobacter sp. H2]WRK94325.1 ATP-binding protein [Altererythrobacter sp. H2]
MSEAVLPPDGHAQLQGLIFAALLLDPEMRVIEANHAAEELLGKSAARIAGMPLLEVLVPEERRLMERLAASDARIIARGTTIRVGDRVLEINLTVSPILTHPGWRVVTLSDARQDDMSGAENNEGVLRTPAVLAHEIKNPLAAIRGASQLIARKLDDKDRRLATVIADEVDRIARLVDRMQQLGSATPEPVAPLNLHEVVRSACQSLRAGSGMQIVLEEEFDPSIPPVLASRDALEQVLVNLLANARDAALADEEPMVRVRTRFVSGLVLNAVRFGRAVKLPVEITVSDNGAGIDPDIASQIFDPFVSSKKGGQGLGLALVKKQVRDMNGRISHERDSRAGLTHFRVHLPVATTERS